MLIAVFGMSLRSTAEILNEDFTVNGVTFKMVAVNGGSILMELRRQTQRAKTTTRWPCRMNRQSGESGWVTTG